MSQFGKYFVVSDHSVLTLKQIKTLELSFHTAKVLRGRAELLPKVPQWKSQVIPMSPYSTKEPVILYYHDALECMEQLFGNPLFAGAIDFVPQKVYKTSEKLVREYSEWMTSDGAWEMQVSIPQSPVMPLYLLRSAEPSACRCDRSWNCLVFR